MARPAETRAVGPPWSRSERRTRSPSLATVVSAKSPPRGASCPFQKPADARAMPKGSSGMRTTLAATGTSMGTSPEKPSSAA